MTGIKGPLEEGWQKKVQAFADQITSLPTNLVIENRNNRASNSPLHGLRRTPLRIMSVVSGHLGPPFARSRSQTVPRWVTGPIGLMRVPRRGGPMTNTSSQDEHENVARGRSRRLLLAGAAGALGLLAGEAIAPATPAQAGTDGDVVLGALNNASTTTTIDTVTSGQDTVAFAAADARTLSVQNDSLSQTVLAINNGGGAALFGFSGGEGVYGQSGITLGTKPGQTRNGVHGVTDSQADSGVWGEAVGGGVGVAGATSTVGIAGNPAVTGVNLGSGPGVKGESRGGGTAVHGVTASGGIGVLAQASGGGTALEVSGPALFSRSGLVTITGQGSATVSVLGGLSASALVLALLQTPVTDLWVRAAEPDQVTGEITIHLNRAPVRSVKVAWFVVN